MRFATASRSSALVRARSEAIERVVAHVWTACVGESTGIALFAVGGFGRAELFPYSDVDLLVLCTTAPRARRERALESFFACLWDLGLKPGHALRTLDECRELAAQDATIYTSLLDARRIAGDVALDAGLAALIGDPQLWPRATLPGRQTAKIGAGVTRASATRPTTSNRTSRMVRVDCATLQIILWLGRRLFAAPTLAALAQHELISASEAEAAEHAHDVLARIRFALHLAAGRAEERLLFDYQRELAAQFGFSDEHREQPRRRAIHAGLLSRRDRDRTPERTVPAALRRSAGSGGDDTNRCA